MVTETELPQDLVDRAMKLSAAGREKLGQMLLESISVKELLRTRIEQLRSGTVELLDADEVADDLEREFGKDETS